MAIHHYQHPEYLPPDFVSFIDKNYETIFEVQEKIKQLYGSARNLFQRADTTKSYDSSVSSDHDVSKIISAKIIPKAILMESYESDESAERHIKEYHGESFDSDREYMSYLSNQFPLVFFSDLKNTDTISLKVTGIPIQFSTRIRKSVEKKILQTTAISRSRKSVNKKGNNKRKKYAKTDNSHYHKTIHHMDNHNNCVEMPSIDEIALEIYNRYFVSKNKSQLTLPPLHSSVLTLLGQRSPTKASPRTALLQGSQHPQQSSTSKHKKLRRHGRKQKNQNQSKEIQPSGGESNEEVLKSGDDPNNTELSTGGFGENIEADEALEANGNRTFHNSRSLFQVINENLAKTSRKYYKDIENLDRVISEMNEKYVKKNITLNPAKINLKEDTWLALPRTWSHTSATFGIPGDSGKLKSMSPLEYLQKYVAISDPRKDLYSLVFRRYRILDNPTGKTITTLTAQKALAEVRGEILSDATIRDLFKCLNIDPNDRDLTETEFYGICAFCERVYSKYPMESCNECYACSKYAGKDKTRCHQNQKSLIEQTDFEYLSSKLRDDEIGPNLKPIIEALCNVRNK